MKIGNFNIFEKKQDLEVNEFRNARSEALSELRLHSIESDSFTKGVENLEKLNKVILDLEEGKKKPKKEFPWEFVGTCVGGAVQIGCTVLIVFAEYDGIVNSRAIQFLKMKK